MQHLLTNEDPQYVARRLVYWGRWNSGWNKKLNITLLLGHLSTLDDGALSEFMEKVWPQKVTKYYGGPDRKSDRWYMINSLEELLNDTEIIKHKDFHNLYELLLYMCGCSEIYAQTVYMQYLRKFGNAGQLEVVQKVTQSNKLVIVIEKLKSIL